LLNKDREENTFLILKHGKTMAGYYLSIVILSYLIAAFFYPPPDASASGISGPDAFSVFLILSAALSVFLLFVKSTYTGGILLLFRCYLIMIQGYGSGGFFTIKLVLGIGLLVESGFILKKPYNFISTAVLIGGILSSQVYNPLFGHQRAADLEQFAGMDTLIIMAFILTTLSLCINLMVNQADRKEEMLGNIIIQRETMKTLAQFNSDLQDYARTIDIESSDKERNRISREIHDISGYIFTNLIALLNAACSIPKEDQSTLSDILITARKQAREGLNETRTALRKTRARNTPEEDGIRAIGKITSIFQKVTGVSVMVNWGNAPQTFGREINFTLYRTIQEALTNAIRHGLATEIRIHFLIEHGTLILTIVDNGQGAENMVKGIGITGMEERIGNLKGSISVKSAVNGGFELRVILPLPPGGAEKKTVPLRRTV